MNFLDEFLGSETRARVLAHFVAHPDSDLHVRALERHTRLSGRSLQLELERLERMGLLRREERGRRVLYTRDGSRAEWRALDALVSSYGTPHLIRVTLGSVPGVKAAFIFGSLARGDDRPDSDIDLLVYGEDLSEAEFGRALGDLYPLLERRLDLKRYDRQTFLRDAREGASFLPKALAGPKYWIIGSEADLPLPAPGRRVAA
jgi:predicted nucleotidyltransferase